MALDVAANLHHVAARLRLEPGEQRKYRVAWVGGCVMDETAALRSVGGFGFWTELPPEQPTTVSDRRIDAPKVLPITE